MNGASAKYVARGTITGSSCIRFCRAWWLELSELVWPTATGDGYTVEVSRGECLRSMA
jgi:hypothetical protein